LPHGSGKTRARAGFAKGNAADAAKAAGAENVGFEDMIAKCQGGWTDFDVAVATPEAMVEVRKLGKVLGPRGLMPNPKTGTVTDDTAKAVKEVKAGRVEFKVDKAATFTSSWARLRSSRNRSRKTPVPSSRPLRKRARTASRELTSILARSRRR
jgi:large subunit ribosomal protein L1